MGDTDVDAQMVTFEHQSRLYPTEIYSAFAARDPATAGYCLRYEAENHGPGDISSFYWKVPDFRFSNFPPRDRASVAFTVEPGLKPVIKPTTLHGFLNATRNTLAYQTETKKAALEVSDAVRTAELLNDASEKIELADDKTLSLAAIGMEFSMRGINVITHSAGFWDGKGRLTISFDVDMGDPKVAATLISPFSSAIAKADATVLAMMAMAKDTWRSRMGLTERKMVLKKTFEIKASDGVRIVSHPLIFNTSFGQVCITARSYAPGGYNLSEGCHVMNFNR